MPPGTKVEGTRILGTCSVDSIALCLWQVTIESDVERQDLLPQAAAFPLDRGFMLASMNPERLPTQRPKRVTVHVRRVSDERGPLPVPINFQLILFARARSVAEGI